MKLVVSAAPHLHDELSTKSIMWNVVLALLPAWGFSVYYFGIQALLLTMYGVISAVLSEYLIQKFRKIPVTVNDGSAVVAGILVSFNIPVSAPWWIPVVGSIFAMAVGKHVFGGLGYNILNPALLARAFLMASWPTAMTNWSKTTLGSISGMAGVSGDLASAKAKLLVSSATPLGVVKYLRDKNFVDGLGVTAEQGQEVAQMLMNKLSSFEVVQNLFWGNIGGVLGETSVIALLFGAGWLAYKHIIEWRIPTCYILTVFVLSYIFGGINGIFSVSILFAVFQVFAGGLILGAFFMATDMVTSPCTKRGRVIFGIGCGVLTVLIRIKGGYPEGVCYSILLMNLAVPLIDRWTVPRFFGEAKKGMIK